MIKNLTAMQETQVESLSWDDLLEKGMATQFSILALPGEFHWMRSLVGYSPCRNKNLDTTEWLAYTMISYKDIYLCLTLI